MWKNHHKLIHFETPPNDSTREFVAKCSPPNTSKEAFLQIMPIGLYRFAREKVLFTWDSAATVSLISNSFARKWRLPSKPVTIWMETIDGLSKKQTKLYSSDLEESKSKTISLHVYAVNCISQDFVNLKRNRIFPDAFSLDDAFSGTASVLLGPNIARYHPNAIQNKNDLVLYENALVSVQRATDYLSIQKVNLLIVKSD